MPLAATMLEVHTGVCRRALLLEVWLSCIEGLAHRDIQQPLKPPLENDEINIMGKSIGLNVSWPKSHENTQE